MGHARNPLRAAIAAAALLVAVGCGTEPAEIGEDCHEPGSTEACVEGGICVDATFDTECRALCQEDAECDAGYACRQVRDDGLKACRGVQGCVLAPHAQGC